jgi:hypothetical protein
VTEGFLVLVSRDEVATRLVPVAAVDVREDAHVDT